MKLFFLDCIRTLGQIAGTSVCLLLLPFVCFPDVEAPTGKPGREIDVTNATELVNAVKTLGAGGGRINLSPGEYTLEETLFLQGVNQLTIAGGGWKTVISKSGAGDAIVLDRCGFCFIEDLLISGDPSGATGSGVVYIDSSSCTVRSCRISNFPECGIKYQGNPKRPMSSNSVLECHFIGNRKDQLHSYCNNDFYICGNQFGTHGGFPKCGCRLDHSSAGTYTMNYHWGNVNAMKLGPGANFNRIVNNRFENSRQTGVIIGGPKGADWSVFNIIIGNTFHTNSEDVSGKYPAIRAYDCVQTTFCSNQVFSWNCDLVRHSSSLILDRGCSHWIVKDNIFRHNTQQSLIYDEKAGHIVKDNLMD